MGQVDGVRKLLRHWGQSRVVPGWGRENGQVAAEFVILFPIFLLIVAGIVELGHLWYVDHVITNASREGARAGVVFYTGSDSTRETWAQNTAKTAALNYLNPGGKSIIPGVSLTVPTPTYTLNPTTGSLTGGTLTVKVTVSNADLVLGALIPAFKNLTFSAVTAMRFE